MSEIKNLSYQNDDGTKTLFNNDSNISEELEKFLIDKKLNSTELQALHYILYYNKTEEILKNSDGLAQLSNQLKYIPIVSDKYKIKNRINNILKLENKEINNKQSYRTLKNESKKLGEDKVKVFQKIIGTKDDGDFGPETFKKYKKYNKNWKNESISDFLDKISGNKKEKEKTFWEDFLDGPDFLKNLGKTFTETDEDKLLTNKTVNHNNFMQVLENKNLKNNRERNKAYIKLLDLPKNFEKIALELVSKLKNNEKITPDKTLLLTDYSTNQMYCIGNGERSIIPVYFGLNGFDDKHKQYDQKTIVGKIHKFNRVKIAKNKKEYNLKGKIRWNQLPADNGKWRNLRYDEENQTYIGDKLSSGGKWRHNKKVNVIGASIQSNLSDRTGGKYFHLIGPGKNATWGCIGVKFEYAETFKQIAKNTAKEGGYGLVSK